MDIERVPSFMNIYKKRLRVLKGTCMTTASSWTIESYRTDGRLADLIKFRRNYLPTGLSLDDERRLWNWKIVKNPCRDPRVPDALIARREGGIVGLLTLMPGRFRIDRKDYAAVGLVDLCADPEASGAGIELLGLALQEWPDRVLFSASANAVSSEIFRSLRFFAVPAKILTARVDRIETRNRHMNGAVRRRLNLTIDEAGSACHSTAFLAPAVDSSLIEWRYGRYPLADSKFFSVTGRGNGPAVNAIYQVSRKGSAASLMLMDYFPADPAVPLTEDVWADFAQSLKALACMESCEHVVISLSGADEQRALQQAGFTCLDDTEAPSCWIKFPANVDGRRVAAKSAYISLATGDRFLTNVYRPPVVPRRPNMFRYRLIDPPEALEMIANRRTLFIRTSPFDHWSFALEKMIGLAGPQNLTVLSNADMPESFEYLFPKFRTLKYPKGRLDAAMLPEETARTLRETDFDLVMFSSHMLSVKYPREIVETFSNVHDFVRKTWPRDSVPVWVVDWSYELKRLDDHYFELEALPRDKLAYEYLSTMIKNRLTPLLPHVEAFNSLAARPKPIDGFSEQRLLILAPHPDDDIIGCGGTILKNIEEGRDVQTIYLTDGAYRSGPYSPSDMVRVRREEALRVSEEIGGRPPLFLDCVAAPTFSITEPKVRELAEMVNDFGPDAIWIPFAFDHHPDHRRANALLLRILSDHYADEVNIYSYEIWSMLPANILVDISPWMEKKRRALALFRSQSTGFDYVHAATGTNSYRSWWVNGSGYYEAFLRLSRKDYVSFMSEVNGMDRM